MCHKRRLPFASPYYKADVVIEAGVENCRLHNEPAKCAKDCLEAADNVGQDDDVVGDCGQYEDSPAAGRGHPGAEGPPGLRQLPNEPDDPAVQEECCCLNDCGEENDKGF